MFEKMKRRAFRKPIEKTLKPWIQGVILLAAAWAVKHGFPDLATAIREQIAPELASSITTIIVVGVMGLYSGLRNATKKRD